MAYTEVCSGGWIGWKRENLGDCTGVSGTASDNEDKYIENCV